MHGETLHDDRLQFWFRMFCLQSVSCRFLVEFGLVVSCLVGAGEWFDGMPNRAGLRFFLLLDNNKHPALSKTQSHVLLSDEIISKGLLCLFVMLYQINLCTTILCLHFFFLFFFDTNCVAFWLFWTDASPVLFEMEMPCCRSFCFHLTQLTCQSANYTLFSISPTDTLIALVQAYGSQASLLYCNLLPSASVLRGLQMSAFRNRGHPDSNYQGWCLTTVCPEDPWNTIWDIFWGEEVVHWQILVPWLLMFYHI